MQTIKFEEIDSQVKTEVYKTSNHQLYISINHLYYISQTLANTHVSLKYKLTLHGSLSAENKGK